jgi:ribonuclease HI
VTRPRRAVEIFTDAGIKDGRGAWAAVIVRRDGRGGIVEASGLFHVASGPNTDLAEARAVANGLAAAKVRGLIEPGEIVLIRTDNAAVVGRWRKPESYKSPPAPEMRHAFDRIRALILEVGCRFELRGVEGHADLSAGQRVHILNARADALCCQALGTKRKGHIAVRDGVTL